MPPVTFTCEATLSSAPAEIAAQILDLSRWSEFQGYGPLPGIRSAEFGVRTPEVVGTRIRVTETTGSQHIEEIVAWRPDEHLQIDMSEFSPPLSWLATHFEELWDFAATPAGTRVTRTFRLHPRSRPGRWALWLISFLLKAAITRHLHQMQRDEQQPGSGPEATTARSKKEPLVG